MSRHSGAPNKSGSVAEVHLPIPQRITQVKDALYEQWELPEYLVIDDRAIMEFLNEHPTVEETVSAIARYYHLRPKSLGEYPELIAHNRQRNVPTVSDIRAVRRDLALSWETNGIELNDEDIRRCWRGNSLGTAAYLANWSGLLQRLPYPADSDTILASQGPMLPATYIREVRAVRDELDSHWLGNSFDLPDELIVAYLKESKFYGDHAIEDVAYRLAQEYQFREGPLFHRVVTKKANRGDLVSRVSTIIRDEYENPDNLEISTPWVLRAVRNSADQLGLEAAVKVVLTKLGLRPKDQARRGRRAGVVNDDRLPQGRILPSTIMQPALVHPNFQRSSTRDSRPKVRSRVRFRPALRGSDASPELPLSSAENDSNQENITPRICTSDDVLSLSTHSERGRSRTPTPNRNTIRPFLPATKCYVPGNCHPCPMYPGEYHHACPGDECDGNRTFVAVVDDRSRYFMFNHDRDLLGRGGYGGMQPDLGEMRRFLDRHDRRNAGGEQGENEELDDSSNETHSDIAEEDHTGREINESGLVRQNLGNIAVASTARRTRSSPASNPRSGTDCSVANRSLGRSPHNVGDSRSSRSSKDARTGSGQVRGNEKRSRIMKSTKNNDRAITTSSTRRAASPTKRKTTAKPRDTPAPAAIESKRVTRSMAKNRPEL